MGGINEEGYVKHVGNNDYKRIHVTWLVDDDL